MFDILEYEVVGNTVLSTLAIERAVYPHLGPAKGIKDVERARDALEQAYRDAGYGTVLVDIPVQKVTAGRVRLAVTEGRIDRVRITGSRYYAQGEIRAAAPSLSEGTVPFFPGLQRELDRLNRAGDRRVTPVLRPGSIPATTEIELKVTDDFPLHGSVELNNRKSPNTTPLRLSGSLSWGNMLGRGHIGGVQVQVSPRDTEEVRVLLLNYAIPLDSGGSFYGYYVNSHSNVAALSDVTVLGEGQLFGLRLGIPLRSFGAISQQMTLGVDRKEFQEQVAQPGTPGLQTPLYYTPFSGDWSASRQDSRSLTQVSLGLTLSFRGLGNDPNEFADKRFKAQSNFYTLRWEAQRTQALGTYSLYAKLGGQIASEPLVSNEQYFAGGATSVRGYLESEALGDKALHVVLEPRSPSLYGGGKGQWIRETRLFAFFDWARVWTIAPLDSQVPSTTLASIGAGLRAGSVDGVQLGLTVARALEPAPNTPDGVVRGLFQLTWRF